MTSPLPDTCACPLIVMVMSLKTVDFRVRVHVAQVVGPSIDSSTRPRPHPRSARGQRPSRRAPCHRCWTPSTCGTRVRSMKSSHPVVLHLRLVAGEAPPRERRHGHDQQQHDDVDHAHPPEQAAAVIDEGAHGHTPGLVDTDRRSRPGGF